MHTEPTDEDLAESVRDGHQEGWEQLALRVIRIARRRIDNSLPESDRDDACQDVLIRFWRALPSFSRDKGHLKGYVAVMTQRQVADYWRAKGAGPETEPIDWVLDLANAASGDTNPDPDLESWIDSRLGAENGKMLRLHIFDGYRYEQIGAEFGISEAAAKQRVYNARKRLRECIEASRG